MSSYRVIAVEVTYEGQTHRTDEAGGLNRDVDATGMRPSDRRDPAQLGADMVGMAWIDDWTICDVGDGVETVRFQGPNAKLSAVLLNKVTDNGDRCRLLVPATMERGIERDGN